MCENVDYSSDARKEGVKLDWTSEEERIPKWKFWLAHSQTQ